MEVTTETMLPLSLKCNIRNMDDAMRKSMPKAIAALAKRASHGH